MSDEEDYPPRGRRPGGRDAYDDEDDIDVERRQPRRRRRWGVAGWILLCSLLVVVGAVASAGVILLMQRNGQWIAVRPPAVAPAPMAAALPVSDPIARQAQQWKIATCLPAISGLGRFLTANTVSSWRLLHGLTAPDKEMFAGTIVGQDKATGLRGVSTMFAAPVETGGCDTGYVLAIYFPESCEQTRARKEVGFEARLDLGPAAEVYSNQSGRGTISLMPAGPAGCLMIRSEVAY